MIYVEEKENIFNLVISTASIEAMQFKLNSSYLKIRMIFLLFFVNITKPFARAQ